MVALIDPAVDRAAIVLQKKRDSFVVSAYANTRIFKTLDDFVKNSTSEDAPQYVSFDKIQLRTHLPHAEQSSLAVPQLSVVPPSLDVTWSSSS